MIALLQRVTSAVVSVKDDPSSKNSIGPGLCVLLGVDETDTDIDVRKIANKISKIRVFSDNEGKMNLNIKWFNQEVLLISQFTLIGETKGQNHPSFIKAAKEDKAKDLYEKVIRELKNNEIKVQTGFFGKYMIIDLALDGPVTIALDSKKL